MAVETLTDPMAEAERCLQKAAEQEDQALMGRHIELAHAWMEIHRLRSAAS